MLSCRMLSVIEIKYITHSFHTILRYVLKMPTHGRFLATFLGSFCGRGGAFLINIDLSRNGVNILFHFKLTANVLLVGLIYQEVLVCFCFLFMAELEPPPPLHSHGFHSEWPLWLQSGNIYQKSGMPWLFMYIHVFNNDCFSQYQIRLYSSLFGLNGGENHCRLVL